jgi:hypothetical protein
MSDVSEHNEKIIRNIDRRARIHELWKAIPGATDEQAIAASSTLAERFEWTGSVLNLDGKPATMEAVREHFGTNYGFLFPPKSENADMPNVDPALLASARAGNMTAKSRLFVQLGRDQTKLDKVLTATPDKAADTAKEKPEAERNNPWLAEKWSITRQGQLYKLDPAMAARLAKAANSHIGATRPSKVA